MRDLRDQIRNHIAAEHLPGEDPASLKDDTPLITGGILDDAGRRDLAAWIEETFEVYGFVVSERGVDHLDSVGSIARMIEGAWARSACEPGGKEDC